tara:strand:+ start:178 stop:390 length:213 start_codon:yes stop_codon:yes gene_type:complete
MNYSLLIRQKYLLTRPFSQEGMKMVKRYLSFAPCPCSPPSCHPTPCVLEGVIAKNMMAFYGLYINIFDKK